MTAIIAAREYEKNRITTTTHLYADGIESSGSTIVSRNCQKIKQLSSGFLIALAGSVAVNNFIYSHLDKRLKACAEEAAKSKELSLFSMTREDMELDHSLFETLKYDMLYKIEEAYMEALNLAATNGYFKAVDYKPESEGCLVHMTSGLIIELGEGFVRYVDSFYSGCTALTALAEETLDEHNKECVDQLITLTEMAYAYAGGQWMTASNIL